jgi:hypothetical protein
MAYGPILLAHTRFSDYIKYYQTVNLVACGANTETARQVIGN